MLEVKRTLVKSGPELWAEVSDPSCLARHLAPFGSIRVIRAQPESFVTWEGELASGCVRLAPAGFGTRVQLEAEITDLAEPPPPPPEPGFWARLLRRRPEPPPAPEPEPAMGDDEALRALTEALEALGTAHHRPFSRV